MEKCTGRQSGPVLEGYCEGISKKRKVDRERQKSDPAKKRRRMSKMLKKKDPQHYGVNCQQLDIDPIELSRLCQETVESLQMTNEQDN